MTTKEKLHKAIEELSEAEAQDALGYIVRRHRDRDALTVLLDNAPIDDEPNTPDEEEGVREAKAEIGRGEVFSAEQMKREFG